MISLPLTWIELRQIQTRKTTNLQIKTFEIRLCALIKRDVGAKSGPFFDIANIKFKAKTNHFWTKKLVRDGKNVTLLNSDFISFWREWRITSAFLLLYQAYVSMVRTVSNRKKRTKPRQPEQQHKQLIYFSYQLLLGIKNLGPPVRKVQ